jgi:hypothetical protein
MSEPSLKYVLEVPSFEFARDVPLKTEGAPLDLGPIRVRRVLEENFDIRIRLFWICCEEVFTTETLRSKAPTKKDSKSYNRRIMPNHDIAMETHPGRVMASVHSLLEFS